MIKLNLIDLDGNIKSENIENTSLIEKKPNKQAIFDAILAEQSGSRQGTHSTLTKAEVRGGGRKPYRQKHTGRARAGSNRSPIWVGGGTVFGPKPDRNYKIKLNKKVRKLAFRSAMTIKINNNDTMLLVDDINFEKPSTKTIANLLKKINLENKKIIFILKDKNTNMIKSCSNIEKIIVKEWNQVSTRDLINNNVAIIQKTAFEKLSEVFV